MKFDENLTKEEKEVYDIYNKLIDAQDGEPDLIYTEPEVEDDYITFNYPHFFDDGRFNDLIETETDFIIKEAKKTDYYKNGGLVFVGAYFLNKKD